MKTELNIRIFSFSYHISGIPADTSGNNGGFVFDCRFLPNPGREESFKHMTGLDSEIISYFNGRPVVEEFLNTVFSIIDKAVENYQQRGFDHLMVSFGCTGGQHRSVYCAERLYKHLTKAGIKAIVHHTEMESWPL